MTVKEAPVRGLRAVFARFRGKGGKASTVAVKKAEAPAAAAPENSNVKVVAPPTVVAETTPQATPGTVVTEAKTEAIAPEDTAPETVVAETPAPEDTAPEAGLAETPAPEAAAPEKEAPETVAAEGEEALPLANYDALTVASLRARLRTLTVPQLEVLISYEKAHLSREEVIGMFERRVAKVVVGETSSFQAVK